MRSVIVLFILFSVFAPAVHAADDAVAKAMRLYEKRHYVEATTLLRSDLPSIDPGRQSAAHLTLGMIYLKNAELHRALYQESLTVHQDYLQKLAAAQGKSRSRFVDLYLGETLLEAGKPDQALKHLERFAADESVDSRSRAVAKAAIGLCYALQKNIEKADEVWNGLDRNDPEIKAALANAYSKAGFRDRKPAALADESLADLKKTGAAPSLRQVKNLISAYVSAGLIEKGLDNARRADLKTFSHRESMSQTKVITFYDVSLLGGLSQLYSQAAIAALEKAAEDVKLRETANFYLGEAYALAGSLDQSIKATASVIASSGVPQQYRDKATARQAANQYQKGKHFEAIGTWDELSKKTPEDPDLLAEILFSCGRLRIECPRVAQKASASADAGEGKRYANLNIALGRYYEGKKDYAKALSCLEAGRDKANKNKIESNDPVMLVALADVYYRTKKFAEALEIYFEMSKQFPEVRQVQEALQGIYATEHKSAGDVKIN
ncbi:MAG TPA: tetratricopeptide repeat protein [Nitrospirota bacterium]|nr:tetratricopeptide repeat protein [Nitrospirota bacterium]